MKPRELWLGYEIQISRVQSAIALTRRRITRVLLPIWQYMVLFEPLLSSLRNSDFRCFATRIAIAGLKRGWQPKVSESTRLDKRIDITLDTVHTGIITSRRRSTDLQKRRMTTLEREHHRYPCKDGWHLLSHGKAAKCVLRVQSAIAHTRRRITRVFSPIWICKVTF
jgi:hypothetical protein